MIEVKHLTKRYGNHLAVDDLTFTVQTGQIYGFLGPNGAGKSTTMNIITGYLAPTDGTVLIDGTNIMNNPEKAKSKIGYLPELPPLYSEMTVEEYLDFVAELKKIAKADRKKEVEKVMEETQITDMSRRLIRNLSKGYKQRVGMAQAMIGNPDVLIFDEPTVGLDPKQIIEVRELIKNLGKTHTVILSSHILSEVSAICDHIMIISKGKLVASDSPMGLQKMMGGKTEILITILGDANAAADAIRRIAEVDDVKVKEPDEKGNGRISVFSADGVDVRSNVSMILAENRIAILGMELIEKSLEDIFLELTDDINEPETDETTPELTDNAGKPDEEESAEEVVEPDKEDTEVDDAKPAKEDASEEDK